LAHQWRRTELIASLVSEYFGLVLEGVLESKDDEEIGMGT